jgi:hypothetical protein
VTAVRAAPRWIAVVVVATWLATLAMALAILWVGFETDFLQVMARSAGANAALGVDDIQVLRLTMAALCAIALGYASVGALLASRPAAGRIGAILLSGGALIALVPFGYLVGGWLSLQQPTSSLNQLLVIMGPAATGPGVVAILPVLAIAFPDGRLPSRRWRWPVAVPIALVGLGTLVQLVRPDLVAGGPFGNFNPIGIEALPPEFGAFADAGLPVGIMVLTAMGITAVVVRYRRGTTIERQQTRWFVAAVALAALPFSLSWVRPFGGPVTLLIASIGLMLVPISVGIAVTRYRLYEIDRLISRTLVYVPLTALVAGLYAASVALLQRVFQSVTGDRSDAAIVISTLILASVFTPLRKWLEGIVDRRFKPATSHGPIEAAEANASASEWEERMAAIALRVVRTELDARPSLASGAAPMVIGRGATVARRKVPDDRN